MAGYTKIFDTMLDSSVWQLSKEARLLWVTMLLKKDRNQMVVASIPGLAHAARLEREEVERALKELEEPDPYSQSKDEGGRRIVWKDDGWWIVNGAKYREKLADRERLDYKASWQAGYRKRRKEAKAEGEKAGAAAAISDGLREAAEGKASLPDLQG